ncbi:unnamed protein product, partial [Mesorhabditis belari]|uniref:Uncharacterized protein n=1 Tax=Mesorhabditis belari TaxID=2138241 RepID=A0AAF3FTG7_9BILA
MSYDDINRPVIAPHRGFNAKAREVLLDPPMKGFTGMPTKSNSDFDLLSRKLKGQSFGFRGGSQSTSASTPKTQSSNSSVGDPKDKVEFDGIGEPPKVAKSQTHKLIGEIGKTRSASDVFRANGHYVDKKLFRTFQQDNVMKMPSMDSDLESIGAYRSLTGDDAVSPHPGDLPGSKAQRTEMEEKRKTVKSWLDKVE